MSGRFAAPQAEESVACNLIPMIDIMFLLLLFFMLGADMSQRELEDIELPKASMVRPDHDHGAPGERRVNVNVFHPSDGVGSACAARQHHEVCGDLAHWGLAIRAERYTLATIAAALREEAAQALEPPSPDAPSAPRTSRVEVMIRADQDAPYSFLQRVLESCAAAGLYKITVAAAQPAPGN